VKKQTFKKGMDAIEAGLQGAFRERFLDFVWETVKDATDEDWEECASLIALGERRTDELAAGDFARALAEIRQERAARQSTWVARPPAAAAPDWPRLARKVEADPAAPELSRSIARALASRDGRKRAGLEGASNG
jgi:hypothetical protein